MTIDEMIEREAELNNFINRKNATMTKPAKMKKAKKNANLYDLIEMIDKLMAVNMPNVRFVPSENLNIDLDANESIEHPIITYEVTERVAKNELKPILREVINDVYEGEERHGEIYGMTFKCLVQFNIYASTYKMAEEIMTEFEDMIFMFTGYLKNNGVREIIFNRQFIAEEFSNMHESLSTRNIEYYVEIEKLTVIFSEKIRDIEILVNEKLKEEN